MQDLRLAWRSLRRSPGFALITVGTLGLAIGAVAGIWSVVDTVLLDPLPYPDADRLVYVAATAPGSDLPEEFPPFADLYLLYSEESELLEEIASFNTFTNTLRTDDRAERVWMSMPTTSLFATLEAVPLLGRLPTPEDEDGVVVLSHQLWTTWFGRDPGVLGRVVHAGGESREIIGVMGPDFWFPNQNVLLWIPTVLRIDEDFAPGRFQQPLVARVAPGVEHAAVVEELGRIARRAPERFGGSPAYARLIEQHRPIVRPFAEALLGSVAGPLWVLLGSTGIVLLIACANVANLFAVRAERRRRDLAVRRALGAARGRLVRSQMAEAVVVAVLAGALAVLLAWASVPLILRAAPADVPRLHQATITPATLLFVALVSLGAALLCGLAPAMRSSAADPAHLRDGGRGSTRRRHWGRDGLVVAESALALVLLIGSGLLVRSFQKLRDVDPGYDTEDLFTFQMAPEQAHLVDGPSFARFHVGFMERLAALPSVESVGIVENVPLNEGVLGLRFRTEESAGDADAGTRLGATFASGSYFETMGVEVLGGRAFDSDDDLAGRGSAIVSASAAELLWPGADPIGRRLQADGFDTWATVVGVAEDVRQDDVREPPEPLVYFPLVGPSPESWMLSTPAYVVKTPRAEEIAPEVRALVREVAPEAPMYRVFTMAGLAADSMVQLSFTMLTLGIASTLALVLGAVGLYGVLSYVVAERTQEIGVRMALGAEAGRVRRMVVAQGARVVALGAGIGIAAAAAATRALEALLYEIDAVDALTFAVMPAALLLVGVLASWVPARRASNVDPIEALRAE